jgi:hypothetical protein
LSRGFQTLNGSFWAIGKKQHWFLSGWAAGTEWWPEGWRQRTTLEPGGFSLGLRRWGRQKTNVVKLEGGPELGEGVGILGEKHGVIMDVDLQWAQ